MRLKNNSNILIGLAFMMIAFCLQGQEHAKMTMGNGDSNWIVIEDVTRDGPILTFSNINIDGDGWVVIHPFEDGKPNGDKYVGATFLKDGDNQNVEIKVHKGLESEEMIIVMLHHDSNANQIFDFVFVDEVNVMDKAVFEGHKMIAHAIAVP